jgi:hypothetical protein
MNRLQQLKWAFATSLVLSTALPAYASDFSFGLFGDVPYTAQERQQLPKMIDEMNREELAFVVHDGDIWDGAGKCEDALYQDRLSIFQRSQHPLIFVPGDNEWTDCPRGGYDAIERLEKLRQTFYPEPGQSLGQRKLKLETQASQPEFAAYRENQRWRKGPVLFVTLNVPGSNNNWGRGEAPSTEFTARAKANQHWLQTSFEQAKQQHLAGVVLVLQADPNFDSVNQGKTSKGYQALMEQLLHLTQNFKGEVLFVHGDTHFFRYDQPLRDPATGKVLANFSRLETYGTPIMGWVKVTVQADRAPLFKVDNRNFGL